MADLGDALTDAADEAALVANGSAEETLSLMQKIIVASMLIVIVCSALVLRGILKPLNRLHNAIEAIRSNKGKLERVSGFNGEFRNIEICVHGVLMILKQKRLERASRLRLLSVYGRRSMQLPPTSCVRCNMQVIYVMNGGAMFRKAEVTIRKHCHVFPATRWWAAVLSSFFRKRYARESALRQHQGLTKSFWWQHLSRHFTSCV